MNFLFTIIGYDLYPKKLELRLTQKKLTSSYFSSLITKLILIVILLYFIFEFVNVLEHKGVQTNIIEKKTSTQQEIKINNDNFRIFFQLGHDEPLEENSTWRQYFRPYLAYLVRYSNTSHNDIINIEAKFVEFHDCNETDMGDIPKDDFNFAFKGYLCPDNFNFSLKGYYDQKIQARTAIIFGPCKNNTLEESIEKNYPFYNQCKSKEEIEKVLNYSYISIYLQDNDVDPLDFSSPITKSFKYFEFFDIRLDKQINIQKFFKMIEIKTDSSIFFNNYESIYSYQHTSESNTFSINLIESFTPNPIFVMEIFSNSKILTVSRNYKKIIDVFSATGGITKILITIGFFLTFKYNEQKEMLQIIKSNNLEIIPSKKKKNIAIIDEKDKKNKYYENENDNSMKRNLEPPDLEQVEPDLISSELKIGTPNLPLHYSKKYDDNFETKNTSNLKKNNISIIIDNPIKNEIELINSEPKKEKEKDQKISKNLNNCNFIKENTNNQIEMKGSVILMNHLKKIEKKKKKFQFSFCEKIKLLFISKQSEEQIKKKKIYQEAENNAEIMLDITYIISKMKEIEKLKEVIFNKDQIKIFNFISQYSTIGNLQPIKEVQDFKELEDFKKVIENMDYKNSSMENIYDRKLWKLIKQL